MLTHIYKIEALGWRKGKLSSHKMVSNAIEKSLSGKLEVEMNIVSRSRVRSSK